MTSGCFLPAAWRLSPPTREAWIEIFRHLSSSFRYLSSPPTREAWIEIHADRVNMMQVRSPPTREAWIEIAQPWAVLPMELVASHPGGVD